MGSRVTSRGHRTRIADVAREAGVSKTAVSFAFNSPDRLRTETATRILEVAESLGYRPDPVAQMLTRGRSMSIGILTPRRLEAVFANPFYAELTASVGKAADAFGLSVGFVSPLHGSLAHAMGRAVADGVIAIGLTPEHPEVEEIRRAGLPIVLVDSEGLSGAPSVTVDDEAGAAAAARHLVGLGHREILVVAFEPALPTDRREPHEVFSARLRGYRSALAEAGIELPDGHVVMGPSDAPGGRTAFENAWEDGLRPTGVLAMSDVMALGVMRAARDLGLAVPADLSVVGFDGIALGGYVAPSLTTVQQPIAGKGTEAVRLLLALIDEQPTDPPEQVRFETRLLIRESSGPVPASRQEVHPGR
jgi:DNA-binding LacI/PurR family transcriptional regulator